MKYSFIIFISLFYALFNHSFLDARELEKYTNAKVQLLNKLTGKYDQMILVADNVHRFDGNLFMVLKACYRPVQKDDIENSAFLEIMRVNDIKDSNLINKVDVPLPAYFKNINISANREKNMIFSGWMFSSSPSLSHMSDNIYDLVLIQCEGESRTMEEVENN